LGGHEIRVLRSSFARLGSFLFLALGRFDLLGLLDLLGVRRLVTDLGWLEVDTRVLTESRVKGFGEDHCRLGDSAPGQLITPKLIGIKSILVIIPIQTFRG
jgi:hypothetical protein